MWKPLPPMRRGLVVLAGALSLVQLGCGSEPAPETPVPVEAAPSPLPLEGAFVAVPRFLDAQARQRVQSGFSQSAGALQGDGSETFYIALRKSELGQRYFLAPYLKTQFPRHILGGAAYAQPTRVVSFEIQNDRLYVFDVDARKVQSDLFSPEVLVDAYPLIKDHSAFNNHPRARDYVLFDPNAALNRFGVMGDREAGANLLPFQVELSFAQRFRTLADGISYEQIFTGYLDRAPATPPPATQPLDPNPLRISGTLTLALRRYQESAAYTPTPLPPREHFFRSRPMLVPNSGGQMKQVAQKWAIAPGMKPITWVITDSVLRLQKDPRFQGYDLVTAMKRGIEGWNEAFGFQALQARISAPGESFGDDELNVLLVDPDRSHGFAAAQVRTNPNTGEVRGADVYLDAAFIETFIRQLRDDPPAPTTAAAAPAGPALLMAWNGMAPERMCEHFLSEADLVQRMVPDTHEAVTALASLTKKEKVERALTNLVLHEIGHTLGLRHNFKGSLTAPHHSSVMEYSVAPDAVFRDTPGPYDIAAVRYLYGLSSTLPQEPFCTDPDTTVDPYCTRYDRFSDPFRQWTGIPYTLWLTAALSGRDVPPADWMVNEVLQFLRAGPTSAVRFEAWRFLTDGIRAPLSPEQIASHPRYAPVADDMMRRILQRMYLDPAAQRGVFTADPLPDPLLTPAVLEQARAVLLNVDGVRGPRARRTMVDVLQKFQTFEAYAILTEAHEAVRASIPGLSGNERLAAEDLARRIDRAISPYFL